MTWRKLKLIDKIIIVSTLCSAIFLIGFWLSNKRPDHCYYLSENFEGWLTIVHHYPEAPPFPKKDGVLLVGADTASMGVVYTSSFMTQGWGRNQFFRVSPAGTTEVPLKVKVEGEWHTPVHRNEYYHFSHLDLVNSLPIGADTVLWDGTRIIKHADDDIFYNKGIKTVEFFYISRGPEPVTFNPPKNTHDLSDKPFVKDYLK